MSDLETKLRFNAVNGEAARLGYRIALDVVNPNSPAPWYRPMAHRSGS
jgi:hypothetical protein